MEEHEPFVTLIEAHPDDRTTRLVYADWLDEHDHPAGDYLRTELRLASLPSGSELAPALQATLRALRRRIEPVWLARFDQPRVMLANPTPFPAGWWCVGIPGVREIRGTYHRFPYDTLPPLVHPTSAGTFDWLAPRAGTPDDEQLYLRHFDRLCGHLAAGGLTVPADFRRWMTDPSVQHIPSCTDCGPERSWDAAPVEGPPGSRVLPFYIDSQGCLTWYLYLTPDGYSAVVASGAFLCNPWWHTAQRNLDAPLDNVHPSAEPDEGELDGEPADFTFVAPSVEAFLYRWWLENTLWHKLVRPNSDYFDATPIAPDEQAYIDFYRQHPVSET